jgi:hypothetical protein
LEETVKNPPADSEPKEYLFGNDGTSTTPSLLENNDDEASMDPHHIAPQPERKNSREQRTKTSIIFVLFEYAIEHSLLDLKFIEQCSTIWKLDKFANASFHSDFQKSVLSWRAKLSENHVLRNRLLKQHQEELIRLTYPLPKRSGVRPIRKRGYSDKGSTRPLHQRFRSDKDTVVAVYYQDLAVTIKVPVYGRRPTVTYRRLPYSEVIGRALELGLLKKEGDFIVPTYLKED